MISKLEFHEVNSYFEFKSTFLNFCAICYLFLGYVLIQTNLGNAYLLMSKKEKILKLASYIISDQ